MITAITQFIWAQTLVGMSKEEIEKGSEFVRLMYSFIFIISTMSSILIDISLVLILDKFL